MPSGKRQLRSASSDARSSNSPLASGTYIKKESPGGLQSKSCEVFVKLLHHYYIPQMFQLLTSLLFWTTKRTKMRKGPVLLAIYWSSMATQKIPKLPTFQIMDRQRYWKISQKNMFLAFFNIGIYFQIFQHGRSRRGFEGASSVVATTPNGKYTPLHNEVSTNGNMMRMGAVKNSRNSTTREMFLAYDDKMSVSHFIVDVEFCRYVFVLLV